MWSKFWKERGAVSLEPLTLFVTLPKNRRIKHEKDFERVFKTGWTVKHRFFLLKFLKNQLSYCRAAVAVPFSFSKKAVERNKIKRIFWAALEKIFPRFQSGTDLVIIVSPMAKEKSLDQIKGSLEEIFEEANIVES